MVCNIRKSILKYDFNNIQTSKNNFKKLQFFTLRTRLSWVLSVHHLISAYFTPYIRLVKFQLARQIPDFYDACVLAGKLFCCIFHRIPNFVMV